MVTIPWMDFGHFLSQCIAIYDDFIWLLVSSHCVKKLLKSQIRELVLSKSEGVQTNLENMEWGVRSVGTQSNPK